MKLVKYAMSNPRFNNRSTINVKGLMLHSVGCAQPKASVFINAWNAPAYKASCVHAIIDGNDGTIYQLLPWSAYGGHCGSGKKGSANKTHIGVEMCEPSTIKYTSGANYVDNNPVKTKEVVKRTYAAAVELFAQLCKEFSLDPLADGVILSHSEGCARGIATNHADVEHLWRVAGLTMDGFRQDVAKLVGAVKQPVAPSSNVVPFRISAKPPVKLHKGAGAGFPVSYTISTPGVFTVIEVKQDSTGVSWGRLKSGAGWVNLQEVQKL